MKNFVYGNIVPILVQQKTEKSNFNRVSNLFKTLKLTNYDNLTTFHIGLYIYQTCLE